MSPKAVTLRLRRTEQLRRLCLSLGKATRAREVVRGVARGTRPRGLRGSKTGTDPGRRKRLKADLER